MTIYSTTIDANDNPQEKMKSSEEYATATFADDDKELVTTDTLKTNDEEYVATATSVTDNEELHNDKNIVKRCTDFKFDKIKMEEDLPCPMLQDGCNQDEFRSFTLQWMLYIKEKG